MFIAGMVAGLVLRALGLAAVDALVYRSSRRSLMRALKKSHKVAPALADDLIHRKLIELRLPGKARPQLE